LPRPWTMNRSRIEPVWKTVRAAKIGVGCESSVFRCPAFSEAGLFLEAESRMAVGLVATQCVPVWAWCSIHPTSAALSRFWR
jgi:hypothetical protein